VQTLFLLVKKFHARLLPQLSDSILYQKKLESGRGLIGFGIVSDPAVGKKMFEGMSRLKSEHIQQLHIFPLNKAEYIPDTAIVEDDTEKLMWIALAYLHAKGGERIQSSTAILQAMC
jgi:uncharacterized protein (DUF169 family)